MKRCPECRRDYYDDSLLYCLDDGNALLEGPASGGSSSDRAVSAGGKLDEPQTASRSEPGAIATGFPSTDEPQTAILHETAPPSEAATRAQIHTTEQTAVLPRGAAAKPRESTGELSEKRSLSGHRAAKPLIAVAFALVVLVGGFFGYRYFSSSNSGTINSIAVLPFENRSEDPDAEYLSDGLSDSLIYRLTQLPNLKVSPTSSVMRYKGKQIDVAEIAKELDVDAVMSGKLVQRDDDLTISVELTDARTKKLIWAEKYVRKMANLLATQREIATKITKKLQLNLAGNEKGITKKYTKSNEAYQLYLKGRYFWNKRTPESLKQAVEFFEQAIKKDPNFALAYSGIAESYTLYPRYSVALPLDSMPKAKEAALQAIELDDTLAEPHVALGIYYADFAWNQPKAEQEFRRAIELNPNYATAHQQFGVECLTAMGRFDEAITEAKRAVELDPLSPIISADLGVTYLIARRYDEALVQLERAFALDPNFSVTNWYLGMVYQAKGRNEDAVAAFRRSVDLSDDPLAKALLVRSLAKAGKRDEALDLFNELQTEASRRVVSRASLALAYGAVGDKDKAFEYLYRLVNERYSGAPLLANHVVWDDLREDPRFAELVSRVENEKLE
ncbi:MAG: tetratricopeptide repeat protein [Pyrinomonadaceae bacterium]